MSYFGKWSQPGVPHKGWTCEQFEDLEAPEAVCEMCERQPIRYVHYMTHPDYPETLACGCECAGRMSEDVEGATRRERMHKNAAKRRATWPRLKGWRPSAKGNPYINKSGYNIVVFRKGAKWSFRFSQTNGTDPEAWARRDYSTEGAAKMGAFDALLWLEQNGGSFF